ncbi:MAG: hypothetical protein ABJF23_01145 [Bryobacteraceae bacterium]
MNWMDSLGPLLQQYTSSQSAQPPADVEEHFDRVAQNAPASEMAEGLAAAFRSGQTPPFSQMASQLFGGSNGQQRAGVLNALLGAVGPAILNQISSGKGGSILGSVLGGGAAPSLGSLFGSGIDVTADQASKVPPEVVKQLAEHAEKTDPSIVDRLSQIYSEHPDLIKTLGGAALTIALAKVAQRQRG